MNGLHAARSFVRTMPEKWRDLNGAVLATTDVAVLESWLESEMAKSSPRENVCIRIVSRINKLRGLALHAKVLAQIRASSSAG